MSTKGVRMSRRMIATMLVLATLGACGDGVDPQPPQEGQTVSDERPTVSIGQGTVAHFEDGVQVGVYSVVDATVASLSVTIGDQSVDLELGPGESAELGGTTVEVVEVGSRAARVVVTGAEGRPLRRG